MDYITMICDIKNSCQLKNRQEVQMRLIQALKEINDAYSHLIAAPFVITMGDEWQGLLKGSSDYNEFIRLFQQKLKGISFYTGIGIGKISINNLELTVNQLDGPSFHKARKAIKIAKELACSLVLIK